MIANSFKKRLNNKDGLAESAVFTENKSSKRYSTATLEERLQEDFKLVDVVDENEENGRCSGCNGAQFDNAGYLCGECNSIRSSVSWNDPSSLTSECSVVFALPPNTQPINNHVSNRNRVENPVYGQAEDAIGSFVNSSPALNPLFPSETMYQEPQRSFRDLNLKQAKSTPVLSSQVQRPTSFLSSSRESSFKTPWKKLVSFVSKRKGFADTLVEVFPKSKGKEDLPSSLNRSHQAPSPVSSFASTAFEGHMSHATELLSNPNGIGLLPRHYVGTLYRGVVGEVDSRLSNGKDDQDGYRDPNLPITKELDDLMDALQRLSFDAVAQRCRQKPSFQDIKDVPVRYSALFW